MPRYDIEPFTTQCRCGRGTTTWTCDCGITPPTIAELIAALERGEHR